MRNRVISLRSKRFTTNIHRRYVPLRCVAGTCIEELRDTCVTEPSQAVRKLVNLIIDPLIMPLLLSSNVFLISVNKTACVLGIMVRVFYLL